MPFRGNAEKVSLSSNPGNFLALLKSFAETDPILSNHLYHPQSKNATYIFSPQSQNDIINVIGYDIILAGIVNEIKASKFVSVIADEVSSHGVEHLPICLRFVDDHCEIREEFIGFVKLKHVRAIDMTEAIIHSIENLGLSLYVRAELLKAVVDSRVHTTSRVPLLNTCITRWVENIEGWERFSLAHPFFIKMCEVI